MQFPSRRIAALPPLRIQGRNLLAQRSKIQGHVIPTRANMLIINSRPGNRDQLNGDYSPTSTQNVLVGALKERIKLQRKVLEDRKHMLDAIKANFDRLEKLCETKEAENRALKRKLAQYMRGGHIVESSKRRGREEQFTEKKFQRSSPMMRPTTSSDNSTASRKTSKNSGLMTDSKISSLEAINEGLKKELDQLKKAHTSLKQEAQLATQSKREVEEKFKRKELELVLVRRQLDSLLNEDVNSTASSNRKKRHTIIEQPSFEIQKANSVIEIKKKINRIKKRVQTLQGSSTKKKSSTFKLQHDQHTYSSTPLGKASRYLMAEKPPAQQFVGSSTSHLLKPPGSQQNQELMSLKQKMATLESQLENLEQTSDLEELTVRTEFSMHSITTDSNEPEDYQVLLEDQFSSIKEVCKEKQICTLQRTQLEFTVQELQKKLMEKDTEWEAIQDKMKALEFSMEKQDHCPIKPEFMSQVIEEHQQELRMMEGLRKKAEAQKDQLRTRIRLLFSEIENSDSKIKALAQTLEQKEEIEASLENRCKEREVEISKLTAGMAELKECVEELSATCPIYEEI